MSWSICIGAAEGLVQECWWFLFKRECCFAYLQADATKAGTFQNTKTSWHWKQGVCRLRPLREGRKGDTGAKHQGETYDHTGWTLDRKSSETRDTLALNAWDSVLTEGFWFFLWDRLICYQSYSKSPSICQAPSFSSLLSPLWWFYRPTCVILIETWVSIRIMDTMTGWCVSHASKPLSFFSLQQPFPFSHPFTSLVAGVLSTW